MTTPAPPSTRRVETKVLIATLMTGLAGLGAAMLNAFSANSTLMGILPPWAQFLIATLVPPLVTFLTAYAAPHTPRP